MEGVRGRGCCCFCNGDDNSYADDDCNGNNGDNSWLSFSSWKLWDDIGNFIFILMFNENVRKNLLTMKVMGGGRGKVGWFFCYVYGDGEGNGNDNDSNDVSLFVLWQQWDNRGDYIFFFWAGVCVLRTFAICMQLLPYFSYSFIIILCSSWAHLPLFILMFGKLAIATLPEPKEAGIENKIAMTSNCYAQRPIECLTGEEWKIKSRW